jgi:hypothetical protein
MPAPGAVWGPCCGIWGTLAGGDRGNAIPFRQAVVHEVTEEAEGALVPAGKDPHVDPDVQLLTRRGMRHRPTLRVRIQILSDEDVASVEAVGHEVPGPQIRGSQSQLLDRVGPGVVQTARHIDPRLP